MTSLAHRQIRYGSESELQTVDVWELPEAERVGAAAGDRYWFIYIHGGAWRDPRCLTDTAVPAIDRLLASPSPYLNRSRIAGFASLGYRLSPHPEFPQDNATTPSAQLRVARHPDHLRDVWAGLAALARDGQGSSHEATAASGSPADYLAHDRYIVYGHSCGAFLAFQLWMSGQASASHDDYSLSALTLPCVVGLEGIYDLRGLVERGGSPDHGGGPGTGFAAALETIVEGAFGSDRAAWDAASPGRFDWAKVAAAKRPAGTHSRPRLAIIAYSPEDELVDGGEIDTMEDALRRGQESTGDAETQAGYRYLALRDLHGRHDEVRIDGREVARVLTEAVRHLDSL